MSNSASSNDASTSAGRGEVVSSLNKKVSTSCAQKVESCNNDGVDHNTSSNIDAVSDNLGRVGISKDDDDDKMSISDEKLFQDPPPKEDCPICMLPMPHSSSRFGVGKVYMPCCGKIICKGCCMVEKVEMNKGNIKAWCACCRMPIRTSSKEYIKRYKKRMELNDAEAFNNLGMQYRDENGDLGLPQDMNKAIELLHKAAELGSINAHYNLGIFVNYDDQDMNKAIHHWKLAAIGGHEIARFNLGAVEFNNGNVDKAMKHLIIAARSGNDKSLKKVGEGYKAGHVTKDEYAKTLRAYQCSCDEMKSDERAKAAAQR